MLERDQNLFRLRQITFGDALRGVLPCEACSTRMEFEISVDSILHGGEFRDEAMWSSGALTFVLRAVTTRDLAEAVAAPDPRRRLLELCTIVDGGESAAVIDEHEEAVVAEFNRLNAVAETRFTVPCPTCGEVAHADLDIGKFLWMEVRHAALTLLREVHELASAYGWAERDILTMNFARRSMYLEMVRA
jgi:hypothetical protein